MEMNEKLMKLKQLVEHFKTNIKQYKSLSYDEANTRVDFIDKFFELLDWDVRNTQEYSEDYREVVREDKVVIQGKPKAPDYSFRIGGTRKFFVEAKKPSVNIKEDIDPAYQIRRYAYTAKLPLSILTDFEEIAVYDTRIKPDKTDKASVARIFYCTFEDYEKHFEFITNTFSKNAILKGSFDRYIEDNKSKKGSSEVDKEFLKLISEWRQTLANNISIRNLNLDDVYQLNYAVQKIMDRIIFLRIAEDRGTEEYALLFEAVHRKNAYQELNKLFIKGNDKYNSDLFKIDDFLINLNIDDNILKTIITEMYYPDCPYEFSVLPIEVLGNIYEQFLGETIRLTPTHQVRIEKKPEVQKAGGVFYTPRYIVNYIVENTVGEKIKGLLPSEIEKIKVLDPACGSGSFLIGAYTYLLNYHLSFYIEEKQLKKALKEGRIYQLNEKHYHLTIQEKQKILLNNIYGVDIDPQAVEVTKLSLLLKLMENESTESAGLLFKHSDLKYLPNLSNNIKCGNSLIGSDFFENENNLFDKETIRSINAFDWEKQFSEIIKSGGFDCLIGNPPYGAWFKESEDKYLSKKYSIFSKIKDVYISFIQNSFSLLKQKGLISFIVPSAWTGGPKYKELRDFLLNYEIDVLILLPFNVFSDAYIDTLIFKVRNKIFQSVNYVRTFEYPKKSKIKEIELLDYNKINQNVWRNNNDLKFIFESGANNLIESIKRNTQFTLNDITLIKRGVLFSKTLLTQTKLSDISYKYFEGDVYRYAINIKADQWVEFNDKMKERPKEIFWFTSNRILLRRLVNRQQRLMSMIVMESFITNKNLYSVILKSESKLDIKVLLAILNSKLLSFLYLKQVTQATKDDFPQVTIKDVLALPFPVLENTIQSQDKLIELTDKIITAKKGLQAAKTEQDIALSNQQIEILDRKIDKLVYELYGLTEEEINMVEAKV